MVRPNGFEPLTDALEGHCSIQLSYERITVYIQLIFLSALRRGVNYPTAETPHSWSMTENVWRIDVECVLNNWPFIG